MRAFVQNLVLFLAACAVALTCGELAVRGLRLAPEVTRIEIDTPWSRFVSSTNPVLKYTPKAGSDGINRFGARDREYAIERTPGTLRIVVLGDSVAFGFCNDERTIPVPELFSKRLEEDLRADHPQLGVEVINLAVSGYDTVQEAEYLREHAALRPDVVLLAYCLNDAWRASAELIDFSRRGEFVRQNRILPTHRVVRSVFLHSHLFRILYVLGRDRLPPPKIGPERVEIGFDDLRDQGEERGFRTVVAIFPLFDGFRPYGHVDEHREVARLARERGFLVLDLLESFDTDSGGDASKVQAPCNREHPNERGHAVAARAIQEYLVAQGLIGPEVRTAR